MRGFAELWLPATPASVRLSRTVLQAMAQHAGFEAEAVQGLAIAACEALANVLQHAGSAWTALRLAIEPDGVTVEVEDDGRGFDPTAATPGGRAYGLRLMRALTDVCEVRASEHGTLVRLVKYRTPGPQRLETARPLRTIGHIRRAIERYERDIRLMLGQVPPADGDVDDLAAIEQYRHAADPQSVIADRRLRIQTLQATIEILREERAQVGPVSRGH